MPKVPKNFKKLKNFNKHKKTLIITRNRILAVGENVSNAVVVKKKFLHISSFIPSVTTDQILNYVEKNAKIDKQHLECTRLVKKDVDVTSLKHVNFKIGFMMN